MATEPEFAQFITDQLSGLDSVATRRMFGEYALYANGKVVGLICDNRLFVKPTEAGRAFIGEPVMAPSQATSSRIGSMTDDGWLN